MVQKNLLFRLADKISKSIYKISLNFPYRHQNSIGDQLRRASLSVVLNLVEGGAKRTLKEKNQFRKIAFSSLKEVKYLIHFCYEMKLINEINYKDMMKNINQLAAILYGLISKN